MVDLGLVYRAAVRIALDLVWHPSWSPDRITERGCKLLGRPPKEAA